MMNLDNLKKMSDKKILKKEKCINIMKIQNIVAF